MAQNMYPSSMDLDDPSPEVANGSQLLTRHHHSMILTFSLIILTVFVCLHPSRRVRVHLVLAMRASTPQSLPPQTRTPAVQVCAKREKETSMSELNTLLIILCLPTDEPKKGGTPVFEFVDPDIQVRRH